MMHRQPLAQRLSVEQLAIKPGLVAVLDLDEARLDRAIDLGLLGRTGEIEAVGRAARQRLATAAPGEDEVDRGQEFPTPKSFHDGKQVIFRRPAQLR